jgi:hypothetical protein
MQLLYWYLHMFEERKAKEDTGAYAAVMLVLTHVGEKKGQRRHLERGW